MNEKESTNSSANRQIQRYLEPVGTYLLIHHPRLWATQIHYLLLIGIPLFIFGILIVMVIKGGLGAVVIAVYYMVAIKWIQLRLPPPHSVFSKTAYNIEHIAGRTSPIFAIGEVWLYTFYAFLFLTPVLLSIASAVEATTLSDAEGVGILSVGGILYIGLAIFFFRQMPNDSDDSSILGMFSPLGMIMGCALILYVVGFILKLLLNISATDFLYSPDAMIVLFTVNIVILSFAVIVFGHRTRTIYDLTTWSSSACALIAFVPTASVTVVYMFMVLFDVSPVLSGIVALVVCTPLFPETKRKLLHMSSLPKDVA